MRKLMFFLTGITLLAGGFVVAMTAANAQVVSPPLSPQAITMLHATEARLRQRLIHRGIDCLVTPNRVECKVAERLHIRILKLEGLYNPSSSSTSSRSSSSVNSCGANTLLCAQDRLPQCNNGQWTCVPRPSSSSSSSSSSSLTGAMDPLTDISTHQGILLLGQTSQIVAGIEVFSTAEPLDVTKVHVSVNALTSSIDSFLIYDESRHLLGRATRALNGTDFTLTLPAGTLVIPRRETHSLYARAQLSEHDRSGVSGQFFTVSSMTVEGNGGWSGDPYVKASTENFLTYQTARSRVKSVTNVGPTTGPLVAGTQRTLMDLRLTGESSDSQATTTIQGLTFSYSANGVMLSNVFLRTPGSDTTASCTVGATTIVCSGITAELGSVRTDRTLQLIGDVTVNGSTNNANLQVSLSNPGSPTSAGDISYSDGTTNFTYSQFDQPIATGTYYQQ